MEWPKNVACATEIDESRFKLFKRINTPPSVSPRAIRQFFPHSLITPRHRHIRMRLHFSDHCFQERRFPPIVIFQQAIEWLPSGPIKEIEGRDRSEVLLMLVKFYAIIVEL